MNIVNSNLVPKPFFLEMDVKEKHSEFKPDLGLGLPGEIVGTIAENLVFREAINLQRILKFENSFGFDLSNISALVALKQLKSLDFGSCMIDVTDEGVDLIARSPNMRHLEYLNFGGAKISSKAIEAIANSPYTGELKSFVVTYANKEIDSLVKSRYVKRIEKLKFSLNHQDPITGLGISAIAESLNMANLRYLKCHFCKQTDLGAQAIGRSYYLSRLETLDLSNSDVTDLGIAHLSGSPNMNNLKDLMLSSCKSITDSALESVASSPYMGNLRKLSLIGCEITDKGIKAIATSEHMINLMLLDLHCCRSITDSAVIDIAESPYMSHLETLTFGYNEKITDAAAKAIARSRYMSRLKVLSFNYCAITNAGMEFIARSTTLVHLEDIGLMYSRNDITYRSFGEVSGLDPTINPQTCLTHPKLRG